MTPLESRSDSILQEDLEKIANHPDLWKGLEGRTVLVTGATGLIGAQMVKAIACRNRLYGTGIRVLGLARSERIPATWIR